MSGTCPKCGLEWLNGAGDRLCIECAGGEYAVAPADNPFDEPRCATCQRCLDVGETSAGPALCARCALTPEHLRVLREVRDAGVTHDRDVVIDGDLMQWELIESIGRGYNASGVARSRLTIWGQRALVMSQDRKAPIEKRNGLPAVGSKWWRRVGASSEGPWTVQEVSHVVRLYLPNPLSPCGAFSYVPLANWPAGFIGAAS